MTLYEFFLEIEIESRYEVIYYDEKEEEYVFITNRIEENNCMQLQIVSIDVEMGKLYITVQPPEDAKIPEIVEQEYVWHVIERRSKLGKCVFYIRRLTWDSYQAAIKEGRVDRFYFDNEISAKECKEDLKEINRIWG